MMAAPAKSDQLVDILKQVQARKTVKPEEATKALTQYNKVQDQIKTLKAEIEIFKANQEKQKVATNNRRGSTITTTRRNSTVSVQGVSTVSPTVISHKRVLNGPKRSISQVANSESGSTLVKKVEQSNDANKNFGNQKDADKDKEIARLRMQNAQLKVTLENRGTAAPLTVRSVDAENGSTSSSSESSSLLKSERLIESFKKIYESEWRIAYHDLEKHYKIKEDNITELLGGIAREAYHFCQATAKQQFEDIVKAHAHVTDIFVQPKYVSVTKQDTHTARSKSIIDKNGYQTTRKFLRDYRKAMAKVPIPGLVDIFEGLVQKDVLSRHTTLRITPKATRPYIHRLIEVTWLMSITEPPFVQIWPRPGQLMSRDQFASYGKKGATIIHTVWPALLLNKDGSLAEKGVCLVK